MPLANRRSADRQLHSPDCDIPFTTKSKYSFHCSFQLAGNCANNGFPQVWLGRYRGHSWPSCIKVLALMLQRPWKRNGSLKPSGSTCTGHTLLQNPRWPAKPSREVGSPFALPLMRGEFESLKHLRDAVAPSWYKGPLGGARAYPGLSPWQMQPNLDTQFWMSNVRSTSWKRLVRSHEEETQGQDALSQTMKIGVWLGLPDWWLMDGRWDSVWKTLRPCAQRYLVTLRRIPCTNGHTPAATLRSWEWGAGNLTWAQPRPSIAPYCSSSSSSSEGASLWQRRLPKLSWKEPWRRMASSLTSVISLWGVFCGSLGTRTDSNPRRQLTSSQWQGETDATQPPQTCVDGAPVPRAQTRHLQYRRDCVESLAAAKPCVEGEKHQNCWTEPHWILHRYFVQYGPHCATLPPSDRGRSHNKGSWRSTTSFPPSKLSLECHGKVRACLVFFRTFLAEGISWHFHGTPRVFPGNC